MAAVNLDTPFSSTCQISLNISVSESLAFLLAFFIKYYLVWCIKMYFFKIISYFCFLLPCFYFLANSSNVNELIRAVLNLFFFFYKNISHALKAQKRIYANKNKKRRSCYALKKGEESRLFAYLRFYAFHALFVLFCV